jgi:formylglycine-generating enzyme required for sulfatase activity
MLGTAWPQDTKNVGKSQRLYPWDEQEPDDERVNFNQIYESTTAVGCFPLGATAEKVYDLASNVWEWTRSEYRSYPYDPADGREAPDHPVDKRFTLRGGGWRSQSLYVRASLRFTLAPDDHRRDIGFRLTWHSPT